jgi:hypothetical protein
MAQDILNTAGTNTGNQRTGNVVVGTGGRGTYSYQKNDDSEQLKAVNTLDVKYDNRFDDPRYYNGDTAS